MTIQNPTNGYYSTRELAEMFHADESTIKRWADRGKIKCFRTPGGHRKFTPGQVIEFVQQYAYPAESLSMAE